MEKICENELKFCKILLTENIDYKSFFLCMARSEVISSELFKTIKKSVPNKSRSKVKFSLSFWIFYAENSPKAALIYKFCNENTENGKTPRIERIVISFNCHQGLQITLEKQHIPISALENSSIKPNDFETVGGFKSACEVTPFKWTHIVCTVNGLDFKMYFDGQNVTDTHAPLGKRFDSHREQYFRNSLVQDVKFTDIILNREAVDMIYRCSKP